MKIEEFVMNNPKLFLITLMTIYFGIILIAGLLSKRYLDKEDSD